MGGQVGLVGVLQTLRLRSGQAWARDLSYHPHVHYLVSGGGLSDDGQHWLRSRNAFLVHVKPLSRLFRAALQHTDLFDQVPIGLSRFHVPGTVEEFNGYKVQYGELPPEAQKALNSELKRRKQHTKRFLVSGPGRPTGSGTFQSTEEFQEEIGRIIRELDSQGEKPLQGSVADRYKCSERQLRAWCKEFTGLKWKDFVKEVLDF